MEHARMAAVVAIPITKRRLVDALMGLIAEKPWELITVADTCRRAGVHRVTFYAHFEGKSDLYERGLAMFFDEVVVRAGRAATGMEGHFEVLFRHGLAHREFYLAVFAQGGTCRALFTDYLAAHARQAFGQAKHANDPGQELRSRFGAGAITAVLEWYLAAARGLPVAEAARLLTQGLRAALLP